ncbi:hypothetical protein F2Q70_00030204 [Brassica cretica]|uniref:Uncharacterized protein n=1 Tax=Brassica cretica TaxID=69181 RepID=A0A8S9FL61_BRACR|nr:hypothetical protein F2Q70_00030204 [Brassica cretica]
MDKIICYSLKIHIKFLFRPSSAPVRVTNPSHRLFPTLAGLDTDYTPDIEADPSRQGFYGVKLHCLNLFLLVTPRSIVQECGFVSLTCYYITAASPSHYAVSSIDDSPDLLATMPPLRFHHITPSQTSTVLHRVNYATFKPSFYPQHRSVNNEMSATTHDFAVALSRVSLVSPPPFYMTRSLSFKTTTIVPQAVVTSFTFRLEKASSFSGELLDSSPRQPLVPVLCFASSTWTSFLWTCSPTPMASDSPSLLLYGLYLHLIIYKPRTAMMSTSTRPEMLCIALSDDYFICVLSSTFIQQGMSIEGQPITLPPAIQVSSETWFNCSQNPLIEFFKVDFDVCAFFRTQALGLQVKLLFGCLSQAVYVFIESSLGIETLVRQIHVLTVFRSVNNEMSATTHDFAVALSRVSLVSPPPFYMTRSPSFKTTTIVPQAVVTSFTFQLEKASSFSWRTFRVHPATAPGPRRLFCFIHVDLFPLDMFPDPDGLRLT